MYGQAYSSDVARRMLYGSRKTLDVVDAELAQEKSHTVSLDIDSKIAELQKERQRFFDQRREYNKLVVADGRQEHLYEALINAANRLDETVGDFFCDIDRRIQLTTSDNEAIIVFSDWHYGMTASNVFNEYNTEICKERVQSVVASAITKLRLHRCSKLHVILLGDAIHGAIHTSARVASEELVCDQIMQVSEILAQSIQMLSSVVDETVVYSTYGNHGRTVAKKKDNIHRDNMERLISWWLQQRLSQNTSVSFAPDTGNEFIFANVAGHDICASHGDLDSVQSSPRLLNTLFHKKYGADIEYIILGDKHHRESFDELGITASICGSLCGTDDYANEKRLFSTPSQLLLIVSPENGVEAEYRIKCVNNH